MSEAFASVDPEIFAKVQEQIEKDSEIKEVCFTFLNWRLELNLGGGGIENKGSTQESG